MLRIRAVPVAIGFLSFVSGAGLEPETDPVAESLAGLMPVTEEGVICRDANGGDFGGKLVFVKSEGPDQFRLALKTSNRSADIKYLNTGRDINLSPNYCAATDKVAVQFFSGKSFDIGLINLDGEAGGKIEPITFTPYDEFNPSWSKDGLLLAYERGNMPESYLDNAFRNLVSKFSNGGPLRNEIYLQDLSNSNWVNLGEGSYPRLSPDGRQIAFIRYSEGKGKYKEVASLWVMNSDGTGARQLTQPVMGYVTHPEWSPNGSTIIFAMKPFNKNDTDLFLIGLDGNGFQQLTTDPGFDFAPYWSAENEVYFTSDRGGQPGSFRIWKFKIK